MNWDDYIHQSKNTNSRALVLIPGIVHDVTD